MFHGASIQQLGTRTNDTPTEKKDHMENIVKICFFHNLHIIYTQNYTYVHTHLFLGLHPFVPSCFHVVLASSGRPDLRGIRPVASVGICARPALSPRPFGLDGSVLDRSTWSVFQRRSTWSLGRRRSLFGNKTHHGFGDGFWFSVPKLC